MLDGETCRLRLVRESDLDVLAELEEDVANRGAYFPHGVVPRARLARDLAETGLWQDTEGLLLIVDDADLVLGHIEFFPTVGYLDEVELSYILYRASHRGLGIATEAVRLLSDHLFGRSKVHRIRLVIHPENAASRRVAEKAGYTLEGVMRGAWFHRGRNHDVELWARLRTDPA